MSVFVIDVRRTSFSFKQIEIEAVNLADAQKQAAMIEYGNFEYSEKEAEYAILAIYRQSV